MHVDRLRLVRGTVVVPPGVPATGPATPERPVVASIGGPALFLPAPFARSVPGLVQTPGSLPTPPPSPVVVPPAGAQGSAPLVGSHSGTPAPSPPDSSRLGSSSLLGSPLVTSTQRPPVSPTRPTSPGTPRPRRRCALPPGGYAALEEGQLDLSWRGW